VLSRNGKNAVSIKRLSPNAKRQTLIPCAEQEWAATFFHSNSLKPCK
jgi:hypothetical protein